MRRVDPPAAQLDGRGRSKLAASTAGRPAISLHAVCPAAAVGGRPALDREAHSGGDGMRAAMAMIRIGCGPLRRRARWSARSLLDIDRAPATLAVRSWLRASACGCRPDRHSGDPQPTAGGPSDASPGRPLCLAATHQICPQPRPNDHGRRCQPPCSRLPRHRTAGRPALTSHSADDTSTYQPEQGGRFECRPGVTFPADSQPGAPSSTDREYRTRPRHRRPHSSPHQPPAHQHLRRTDEPVKLYFLYVPGGEAQAILGSWVDLKVDPASRGQEPAAGRQAPGTRGWEQPTAYVATWQVKERLDCEDLSPMEVARMLRTAGLAEASQLIYEQECTQ